MQSSSIYEIGASPRLGVVPERMYAAIIRPERYGPPKHAFRIEEVEVPRPSAGQVLVHVMAAGINFNNVWASLGKPLDVIAARQRKGDPFDFHIGGSEASGVVWAVGDAVRNVKVGQPVIVSSCRWDEHAEDIRLGADPMTSATQSVWGYEENFGSFAQFTVVEEYQCHPKPDRLTWEEAACFLLTGATAYRMLCGWPPHVVQPGDPILIWGGAGGLGSMAIQIAKAVGARPVAVLSDDRKTDHCMKLGAKGVINRSEFKHWGRLPDMTDSAAFAAWLSGARAFGSQFWKALGERRNPRLVMEHPGQATLPTSMFVCDNAGMIVICGGTSGYAGDVDLRYLWMRQKRLQGSHFANRQQCAAITHLVEAGKVSPCLSQTATFSEIGAIHQQLYENRHPAGNMAVLVNAPRPSMTSLAV